MTDKVNDVDLNRQFVETGDKNAFDLLFGKYYAVVRDAINRMARHYPDSDVDADDIAQETFIKALEKREQIQVPEKLLGWLLTTARNLTTDKIRALNSRTKYLSASTMHRLHHFLRKETPRKPRQLGTD